MSDIAMCRNKSCPSFDKCYRAQATPNKYWQSFGGFKPKEGEDKCDRFVSIKE